MANAINKLTDNGKDFNSRIIKQPQTNDKYMIIMSQGFIEYKKAMTYKKMADNKLGYDTYVSRPSYSTNIFKKILYLNTHYLPSSLNKIVYKIKL